MGTQEMAAVDVGLTTTWPNGWMARAVRWLNERAPTGVAISTWGATWRSPAAANA